MNKKLFLFSVIFIFNIFLGAIYAQSVDDKIIALEKRRLEKKLEYYENECITKYTGLNKDKHKEWCDFGAEKTKKRIEELENDPELYFYMKKERDDKKPSLGITPDGRVVPIIPLE